MKLLIGVKSCQHDRDRGDHEVIRNTWGKNLNDVELCFFMGGESVLPWTMNYLKEVTLNCPDNYDSLTLKTIEAVRFILGFNYTHVFLCDTDTYVRPDLLMKTGFENFDYYGLSRPVERVGTTFSYEIVDRNKTVYPKEQHWTWCSGGYGYFLSRKAMEAIVAAPKPSRMPWTWVEDMFVGSVIGPLHKEGKLKMGDIENFMNRVTWHFPQSAYQSQYDPKFGWMEKIHAEQKWS